MSKNGFVFYNKRILFALQYYICIHNINTIYIET